MKPSNRRRLRVLTVAAILTCSATAATAQNRHAVNSNLNTYESEYYVIHSDLPIDVIREAHARMTAVAEEYHRRTKGFGGQIRRKFPFYFYSRGEDYTAAGGMPGSAGMYNGKVLMARADRKMGDYVWKVLQHEAWHQFMHVVVGGKAPIWVNEGLAEYFAEGVWTGDALTTGVVPPGRLKRVKALINGGKIMDFLDMLEMTHDEWTGKLSSRNYDQAWSMCHFLIHADEGKYQQAFAGFIGDISRGRPWRLAFTGRFGNNVQAFQQRYSQWWLALGDDPTRELCDQAAVETLTSFLARADTLKLKFDRKPDAFFEALDEGKIAVDPRKFPRLWLPRSLAKRAVKQARQLKTWSLVEQRGRTRIVLTLADGTTFTGAYALHGANKPTVDVKVTRKRELKSP